MKFFRDYRGAVVSFAPSTPSCIETRRKGRFNRAGRAWYRLFWGHRPVPARLESALHRLR
jgi:hypothetical protein